MTGDNRIWINQNFLSLSFSLHVHIEISFQGFCSSAERQVKQAQECIYFFLLWLRLYLAFKAFAGNVWPAASGVVAIKSRWAESRCWQDLGRDLSFATALAETPTKKTRGWFCLFPGAHKCRLAEHTTGTLLTLSLEALWTKIIERKWLKRRHIVLFMLHNSVILNLTWFSEATHLWTHTIHFVGFEHEIPRSAAQTGTFCPAQQSDVFSSSSTKVPVHAPLYSHDS